MRIEQLHIDGFGIYRDASFGPFDAGLTVLTGLNEAGKSTLLAFIRAILFGFPVRRGAEHYPPLAGGRHGGRITILTGAGERFTIERYQGRGGGPVTITAAEGLEVDAGLLPGLLGNASGEVFRSVFAFDLEDLQQLAGDEEKEISRHIYSAGMGAVRLPIVLEELEKRAGEIFAPRGQNQPVAVTLRKLQEVEAGLGQVQGQAAAYGRDLARREQLEREIERLRNLIARREARRRELLRYREAQEDWNALCAAEGRLAELPEQGPFPEDPIGRLESLEKEHREKEALARDASAELKRAVEEAERPIADGALLEQGSEIESMRRRRDGFDSSIQDLPEREAELRAMEAQLHELLRRLGPGWDESRLEDFDTSVPRLDEVEQWRQRLTERRQLVRDSTADLERERKEHRDALAEEEKARETLEASPRPPFGADEMKGRRAALRDARRRLDDHIRAYQRLKDLERQRADAVASGGLTPGKLRLGGAVLLALGTVAPPAIYLAAGGGTAVTTLSAVLAAVLFTAAGGAFLLASDTRWSLGWRLDVQVRQARDRERVAREALRDVAGGLGIETPPGEPLDPGRLDTLEADLERAAAALAERETLATRLEEARARVEQRRSRVEEAEAAAKKAAASLREAEEGWAGWLRARGLPETLTPETVRELFSRIEEARAEARRVADMRGRIAAIRRDIDGYRELVAPLVASFAPGLELASDALVAKAADALIERFEEARREHNRRAARQEAVEKSRRDLQRAEERLRDVERRILDLLAKGGTDDPEEFRRRARIHLERAELELRCRELEGRLRQRCGPGQDLDHLRRALAGVTSEEIEVELATVEAELEDLTRQRDNAVEERGSVGQRLKQLSTDETGSRLRAERLVLIEHLRSQAEEWSHFVLARALLDLARQRYEEERQPAVIRRAERFFATLTGGRYARVIAPLGGDDQEIRVVDQKGGRKRPGELSRGTREQLYLALRLGLIQEFGEREERLPVILDEVLVDFDPERARQAAAGFVELSRQNQVLVFTCHPWLVELFRNVAPETPVVRL